MGNRDKGSRLNWFRDHLPQERLVLDASVLINVLACGATDDVFEALRGPCLVEEKVFGEIRRHPIPGLCHVAALRSQIEAGCIELVRMDESEYQYYLSLVQAPLGKRLDAGESATLAVAQKRGMAVVVDERKGRSYVAQQLPQVEVVSSLKLFISVAFRLGRDVLFVRQLLTSARENARMSVPKEEAVFFAEINSDA